MDMKYNVGKSTDCKILRGDNGTLEFEYAVIFEGDICLFVPSSSFHWASSMNSAFRFIWSILCSNTFYGCK